MSKAVQFDQYGDVDVLDVRDVERPVPAEGQVLVAVKAAGINPGEAAIRRGVMHDRWPATFPSVQGSDLAGVVAEVGPGVDAFAVGDEVLGFSDQRASHAEFVVVPAENLTAKPASMPWDQAGALYVAGTTAYAAVRAVALAPGDTVAVSGAAGGVGSIAVQLARRAGATVIGIAGPGNDEWLTAHGVIPVNYGHDLANRIRAAATNGRVDAFLDFFGGGYVELAVTELGVEPRRVHEIHVLDLAGNRAESTRPSISLPWNPSGCRLRAMPTRRMRPCWPNSPDWSQRVSSTSRSRRRFR